MRTKLLLFAPLLLFTSCFYFEEPFLGVDQPEEPWSAYRPVYMERQEADEKIKVSTPREIETAGKFYLYNQYLLLVEQGKGIHVYDNSNIANPEKLAFIEILNATDIAISNKVMYLNQSTDLVAIDFSDLDHVEVTSRIENVSENITPDALPLRSEYQNTPPNSIVVGWEPIND